MKIRKLLRILHRDLGYFIVGMTIVYGLSGIILNHRHDFNPDYQIIYSDINWGKIEKGDLTESVIIDFLAKIDREVQFKKYYFTNEGQLKIFISNGQIIVDPSNGKGYMEYLKKRPLFFEINILHRATTVVAWKWVSDIMAAILIFVAVSGLFLLKGKRGLLRWGWWLTIAGFVVPLFFMILYIW